MVLPLGDSGRTRIVPIATYLLIALNVAAYLLQLRHGDEWTNAYAATPWEITHNEDLAKAELIEVDGAGALPRSIPHAPIPFPVWVTLFTSIFLHGSPLHLAGNMLYLWIFGDNVEEVLGTFRYLLVYFAAGIMGTIAQVAANPESHIPTLGASGAIAGVMGAYVVWFPRNRVRVLFFRFITETPAILAIGAWIALQVALGARAFGREGVGVAYLAHIGGAATGLFSAFLFADRARDLAFSSEPFDV